MHVNIYTTLNGVGLQMDADLLKSLLVANGYGVTIVNRLNRETGLPASELGIHLEHAIYNDFHKNKRNIFIPNPEWCDGNSRSKLNQFDAIFCKTHHAVTVFAPIHKDVRYCGFTSIDHYNPKIKKSLVCFHLQGNSQMKNTEVLKAVYSKDRSLPVCYAVSAHNIGKHGNLIFTGRQTKENLQTLLNGCLVHICPSQYEGFGHYINEARGCGAVVITTDTPPMNEFIKDRRFLVSVLPAKVHNMVRLYNANESSLQMVIKKTVSLPFDELIEIGKQNRVEFLKNDFEFKERFIKMIK